MNEQDATRRLKLPSIDILHRLTTASVVSGVSRCAMRDMIDAAADEIERLRRERDEARHGDSVATATLQGCIEERTTLRAERDEARRRLCLEWTEHGPVRLSKEQIAMRYGWDCFKENTK
jgi:hypothetical protein